MACRVSLSRNSVGKVATAMKILSEPAGIGLRAKLVSRQSNIPHAIWGGLLRKDQNAKELVIENFMLVKGWPLAQTVSHMKTPSGTFTLAALAAIAIGAILTFRLLAQSPSPSPTPA